MDIEYFKKRLLAREAELNDETARFESDARESRTGDVEDPIDRVTSDEIQAASFQESTITAQMLNQVRAALDRIKDGTYGTCIDCGRPIEPARLEAVPWTPYCLANQERHDREAAAEEPDLSAIS